MTVLLTVNSVPMVISAEDNDKVTKRDIIIVIEDSIFIGRNQFLEIEKALNKFNEALINSRDDIRISYILYREKNQLAVGFGNDPTFLRIDLDFILNEMRLRTFANFAQALKGAYLDMEEDGRKDAIKDIIFISSGLPSAGEMSDNGRYTLMDTFDYYKYANAAYNHAKEITKKYNLYSFGCYNNLSGKNKEFAQRFMYDVQNAGYYELNDIDKIDFLIGDVEDNTQNNAKKIDFTYQSGYDYTSRCYYTDEYFSDSSYNYNQSLCTMSLALAMTAFASSKTDYDNQSINARNLMKRIGIKEENIAVNDWFTKKPETDSIGVIAGNKKIRTGDKDYTLIAVAIRGSGYEKEWAGNFTLGLSGQHRGFCEARDNVITFLRDYIKDKNITGDIKLWITGYSRAAAAANLVAGAIDDDKPLGNNISYTKDDVYTYCFETPAGASADKVQDKKYGNIFNIINPNDIVTYVAPAAMGFARYGQDKYIPSKDKTSNYKLKKQQMLEYYNKLSSTDKYIVDSFQMKKVKLKNWFPGGKDISIIQNNDNDKYILSLYLQNLTKILSKEVLKGRENYCLTYEDEVREVMSVMLGGTSEQTERITDRIMDNARNGWPDILKQSALKSLFGILYPAKNIDEIMLEWITEALDKEGVDYDKKLVKSAVNKLSGLAVMAAVKHPDYTTTLVYNMESIEAAHYPELCLAWMQSMDSNYREYNVSEFSNGSHRVIRINCLVNVYVYNEKGVNVAAIIDDIPQDIEDSTIISSINEDGEKIIVLPSDADYKIEISGREDCTVNYGISEYCAFYGDYTRNINYFNINLGKDEKLTGYIPSYSEEELSDNISQGSTVNYSLIGNDNTEIKCDSDMKGEEAMNAYYNISINTDNEAYGMVTGSGIRQYGSFAQAEAVAAEGYKFEGWYRNSECVSAEDTYRWLVTEDTELTASFIPENNIQKPVTDTNNNSSNVNADITDKDKTSAETGDISDGKNYYILLISAFAIIVITYGKSRDNKSRI